jgi:release factor glutamine methyltransferase
MQAPRYLVGGGWLLVEHGYDQSTEVMALMQAAGFGDVCSRNDLAGIPRITVGRHLEASP